MDDRARLFIERATLLFIASRNAEGKMDVSPRGGQPVVVRLRADGSLLLPDYVGNRRLDTIGNVLSNHEVALLLLNRFNDEYLRISAKAAISRSDSYIAAFPADENRPLSVMVLTPSVMEFIKSSTFARTGFWVDPDKRKPPLDLMDIYLKDTKWQAEGGRKPVARDAAGEQHLADTGLRDMYGTPSIPVQTKVYNAAGPGGMAYLEEARFIVFAREDGDGRIALDLVGGVPLRPDPTSNEQSFLLVLPRDQVARSTLPHSGECALLAVEPGRCENMRMNGIYGNRPPDIDGACKLSIRPEEIYFHCSAAFARSRIWTDSRPIAWSGQRSFTCAARKRESPDVVSFVLKPRDDAPIGPVVPGQYVTVLLPKDEHQPQRRRCYSVSRTPDAHAVRISVRRIGGGGVSDMLHDRVDVGDEVFLGAPGGQFVLDSVPLRPVVLVSAGVGITPLLPMLEELGREPAGRDVWFVHMARNARHRLFGEEALRIARDASANVRLFTAYSRPESDDACDHVGRIDAQTLASLVPATDADFYICGPDEFMTSLKQGLIDLGAASESIRTEAFEPRSGGLTGALVGGPANRTPCRVEFARSGKSLTWKPENGSLLDLALAHSIDVQYSCRNGECQSCVQRVVSGSADYPAGEEPLLARGQVLLCQAIPRGDLVIDC